MYCFECSASFVCNHVSFRNSRFPGPDRFCQELACSLHCLTLCRRKVRQVHPFIIDNQFPAVSQVKVVSSHGGPPVSRRQSPYLTHVPSGTLSRPTNETGGPV